MEKTLKQKRDFQILRILNTFNTHLNKNSFVFNNDIYYDFEFYSESNYRKAIEILKRQNYNLEITKWKDGNETTDIFFPNTEIEITHFHLIRESIDELLEDVDNWK